MKVKRILSVILSVLLISSTLVGLYGTTAWADECDIDNSDDGNLGDSGNESDDPTRDGAGYHIEPNTHHVSLGTVTQGESCSYVPLTLTNQSSRDISVTWYESDPEHVLIVDAPQDPYMYVGGNSTFYIKANTSAPTGQYNMTMLFGDVNDPGYKYGTKVEISVTIVSASPYVTGVTVSPGRTSVATGSGTQFSASVQGGNNPSSAVTWSVRGNNNSGTTIDSNGYLRVDSNESSSSIQVVATSVQDTGISGTASVSIVNTDHTLTVQAEPAEGGNVNGGGTIASGGSMTVLAAPNISYQFVGWYLNGNQVSNQPKYTQTNITSDMTLVAKFKKNDCYVTVKTNHGEAGEVTASQFVNNGGSLTLQASAKKGWQFECWQENGKTISSDVKFTLNGITSDRTITAIFSQTQYTVSIGINPNDCGKVSGTGTFGRGANVKLKAEPYDGYKFKNWTLNGNVVSNDAEFTIKNIAQDYCLVANFEKKGATNYSIQASVCTSDGIISPAGVSKVQQGGSMVYTITPKSGYRVYAVAVDNVQIGAVTSYTFTNVGANHTIVAAFAPIEKAKPVNDKPQTPVNDTPVKHQAKTDTVTPVSEDSFDNQIIAKEDISKDATPADDYFDYDSQEGIYQEVNKTENELAEILQTSGESRQEIGMLAIYNGYLQVAIYDEFDNTPDTTGGNFITNPYLPNAAEVVTSVLSDKDISNILNGNKVKVNINIYDNTRFIDENDKASIDAYATRGMKIGRYFEVLMMKTSDANTETITETPVGLKVCMDIPEDLRNSGRTYYIIRSHKLEDGTTQMAILPDEDNNPDTITITTDKFSAYALAYEGGSTNTSQIIMAVLIGIVAVLALVIALVLGTSIATSGKKHHRR